MTSEMLDAVRSPSADFAADLANDQRTNGYGRQTPTRQISQKEKRRRYSRQRGLPERKHLINLAKVWLTQQRRLWPAMASGGILPEPRPAVLETLAAQFADGFLAQKVARFEVPVESLPCKVLGTSYLRYSSDKSNPRSLDDQLILQLERAAQDGAFIPWEAVFADAGVTGTTSQRNGYQLAKECLAMEGVGAVSTLYIDEIGRASRDAIEALMLGRYIDGLEKWMIGVSDNFDSREPMAKMRLMMLAMMNEWFVDQLRAKINRSREGRSRRGVAIFSPPLGIKLVEVTDANGKVILNDHGKAMKKFAIDEEHVETIRLIAKMFVDDRLSACKIAKEFNRRRQSGKDTWTAGQIFKMLQNYMYVGICITNRYRHYVDHATNRNKTKELDRKDWHVRRIPEIQIWPWRRWKQIRARIAEVRREYPPSRPAGWKNKVYPTTPLSGLLYCGVCGRELTLFKSCKGHYQFHCPNGRDGARGCTLQSTKSLNVLQKPVLKYVRERILTADRIRKIVGMANEHLKELAAEPTIDTTGLKASRKAAEQRRDRLIELVGLGEGGDLRSVRTQISRAEQEIQDLTKQINEAERQSGRCIRPLDEQRALALLDDMEGLVEGEPRAAGLALQKLLGPIEVREVQIQGMRYKSWVGTIRSDFVPFLASEAAKRGCPDSSTWGMLCERKWTMENYDEILLEELPRRIRYAQCVTDLVRQGNTVKDAAKQLGIPYATALSAFHHQVEVVEGAEPRDYRNPRSHIR